MSTLDKINSELYELQEELSQLSHYTNEIGEAKDAARNVVNMSLSFLKDFQARVTEINKQMDIAAKEFKKGCDQTSRDFDGANKAFQAGIGQAKDSLSQIGSQLAEAAKNVNDLAVKIESINIIGHFDKVHSAQASLKKSLESSEAVVTKRIAELQKSAALSSQEIKKNQMITFGLLALVVILVAVGLFMR